MDKSTETTLDTFASLDDMGGTVSLDYGADRLTLARGGRTVVVIRATSTLAPENYPAALIGLQCRLRGLWRNVDAIEDPDGRRRHWRLTLGG